MRYALARGLYGLAVLLAVSALTFALLELAPGEFFDDLRLETRIAPETIDAMRRQHGLDEPVGARYLSWLGAAVRGDFGVSLAHGVPVSSLLWERAGNTLLLTAPALVVTWLVALPAGIWIARRRGSWADRASDGVTSTLVAAPDLLIALVLLVVAVRTGLFPTGGMASPGLTDAGAAARAWDVLAHAFLPMVAVVASMLPPVVRHVRASVSEAVDAPAVTAARGHGIHGWRLTWRYLLPMAANPLVSLAGLSVASLLSASLLIEIVMSWPGLGPLVVDAVLARDVPVVLAASMLAALCLVAGNLLADVALHAVDPRIRG